MAPLSRPQLEQRVKELETSMKLNSAFFFLLGAGLALSGFGLYGRYSSTLETERLPSRISQSRFSNSVSGDSIDMQAGEKTPSQPYWILL